MPTFLLKTEPSDYSFADLMRDKRTRWVGVTNPQAVLHLRSAKKGDAAWIYHTGDDKAIVGLARITRGGYADPDRQALTAAGEIRFAVIDIEVVGPVKSALGLTAMKADPRFKDFALIKNSRLSVMPVPPDIDRAIRELTGIHG